MRQKKISWGIVFLTLPFFSICFTDFIPLIKNAQLILKVVAFLYISIQYFNTKLGTNNKVFNTAAILVCILLASTFINDGDYIRFVSYAINILMPFLIINVYQANTSKKVLFYSLLLPYIIMLTINLIFLIICPFGIYKTELIVGEDFTRYNFLGLDNQIAPYILVSTSILFHKIKYLKKVTLQDYYVLLIIIANTILIWSMTLVISELILIVSALLSIISQIFYKRISNVNFKIILLTIIMIFIGVSLFDIQLTYKSFFENTLGKSATFSGRSTIWRSAINHIKQDWLLGLGIQHNDSLIYFSPLGDYRNSHNTFLQIGVMGGLPSLICFLNIISLSLRKKINKISQVPILMLGLTAFCVAMLSEFYPNLFPFFIIISLINSTTNENRKR